MDKALFIVSSPFQALCASEAISHYDVEEPYFMTVNDPVVIEKTVPICKKYGETHILRQEGKGTVGLFKALVKGDLNERFDNVFLGDYYSYGQYIIALYMSNRRANFIYLDDGNSTLLIAPPISLERGRTSREKKYNKVWDAWANLKHVKKRLFTIFDINEGCPMPVEKNTFSSLLPRDTKTAGVFVIGTNTDLMEFKNVSYADKLSQIALYIKRNAPDEDVYYCPHRRDSHDYSTKIELLGWYLFDTQYNVEIDFVQKNLYPRMVLGFGSTALLTLKKIFPSSDVKTIYMDLELESTNKEYRSIESYYMMNGIEVVHI